MNSIEEKIWNYIDGTCPPEEQLAIARLIEHDEVYREKYNQLLKLNAEFLNIELDEPSMAFTYNVMETIRAENAQQPLKAAIDKRIILGIAAFFILTLTTLLFFALSHVNWSAGTSSIGASIKMPEQVSVSHINNIFNGPVGKGFLFFDVVMGLFLLDHYLRRKSLTKTH